MDSSDIINEALQSALAGWVGCDWETQFGERKSNLRGLRSRQARLAMQATRGEESAYWQSVYAFLEAIEHDAGCAADHARDAVAQWNVGDIAGALARLDKSIALEARYREPLTYPKLRELLQASQATTRN